MKKPAGVNVIHVAHGSRVAAVTTSAGPKRLLEAGFAHALGATGRPVDITEIGTPTTARGAVGRSFAVADAVARHVACAFCEDRLPIVLSGSCHAGLGAVSGLPSELPRGVAWLDRHGDFHTPETTESGLLDGTTLACVTGRGWAGLRKSVTGFRSVRDRNVLLLGVRDLDPGERESLSASDVCVLTDESATDRSPAPFRALGTRVGSVYLHLDLDVLDAGVGKANAFATAGGLSEAGLLSLTDAILRESDVGAIGLTSYDPAADPGGDVVPVVLAVARTIARRIRS